MKSLVFDNAGTILQRVTVLKDMSNNNFLFETNTIGITNEKAGRIIVVLQTPTKNLIKKSGKIYDYLKKYPEYFEISYSREHITKEEVIQAISNDMSTFHDLRDSAKCLVETYDIEICSGSALIVNTIEHKIEYVFTAGGLFFKDTRNVIDFLKKEGINIYIASGDNKQSLKRIASILNIPFENIYDTMDSRGKEKVVKNLQDKGHFVYMVGNNTNDQLAIKQANIGVLTLEQKEVLPDYLLEIPDYKIRNIGEIIDIIKKK
ncbi:HAD family hydrolase [Methanosphaera sp.]